jgi:hypothetical protein
LGATLPVTVTVSPLVTVLSSGRAVTVGRTVTVTGALVAVP